MLYANFCPYHGVFHGREGVRNHTSPCSKWTNQLRAIMTRRQAKKENIARRAEKEQASYSAAVQKVNSKNRDGFAAAYSRADERKAK